MKRALSIILMSVLLFAYVPAVTEETYPAQSSAPQEQQEAVADATGSVSLDSLLGLWYVSEIAVDNSRPLIPIEVFEGVLGESYSLTVEFKENNICVFTATANGESTESVCSYSLDSQTITRDGADYSFNMNDMTLIIQGSATGIAYPSGYEVFVREADMESNKVDSQEGQANSNSPTEINYPFPTVVEGYTFISFADSDISLYDDNTVFYVFKQYFEQTFPNISQDQLKEFFVVYGDDYGINEIFACHAGEGQYSYYFPTYRFYHPLAEFDTCIDVLISYGYRCAFVKDPPQHMEDYLHKLETLPITFDDALKIAKQAYQAQFSENGLPVPDETAMSSLLIQGGLYISYNESSVFWQVNFFVPQTSYDYLMDWSRGVFDICIDAYTGNVNGFNWFQTTPQNAFLDIIGE